MWRSKLAENAPVVVAVIVGVPIVGALFLGVFYYCCLEWLHDALAPREPMPTTRIRAVGTNP